MSSLDPKMDSRSGHLESILNECGNPENELPPVRTESPRRSKREVVPNADGLAHSDRGGPEIFS